MTVLFLAFLPQHSIPSGNYGSRFFVAAAKGIQSKDNPVIARAILAMRVINRDRAIVISKETRAPIDFSKDYGRST